jgi:hypothetical protein
MVATVEQFRHQASFGSCIAHPTFRAEINYCRVRSVALRLTSLIAAAVQAVADPAAIFTYQRSKSGRPYDVPRATTCNGRREPLLAILKGRIWILRYAGPQSTH